MKSPERYKDEFVKQHPNISYSEIAERYVRYSEMMSYEKTYNITWTEKDYAIIFEEKKNEVFGKLWNDELMLQKYGDTQKVHLLGKSFSRLSLTKRKSDDELKTQSLCHFLQLSDSYDSCHKTIQVTKNQTLTTEDKNPVKCFEDFLKDMVDMKRSDFATGGVSQRRKELTPENKKQ